MKIYQFLFPFSLHKKGRNQIVKAATIQIISCLAFSVLQNVKGVGIPPNPNF